jgi:chorismate mutase
MPTTELSKRVLKSLTEEQIEALRAEAGEAGDQAMVAICDRALAGSASARDECAEVIADARAERAADEIREIAADLIPYGEIADDDQQARAQARAGFELLEASGHASNGDVVAARESIDAAARLTPDDACQEAREALDRVQE